MRWKFLILFILFVEKVKAECLNDQRNSFLWSVQGPNEVTGYLFGTIHVPYTQVWDKVSVRAKEAFGRSDAVIFEIGLHEENVIRKLIKCKSLKKHQTARSYLPSEIYSRLESYMKRYHKGLLTWAEHEAEFSSDAFERVNDIYHSVIYGWERKRAEWLLFTLYQLCESLLDKERAPMLDTFLAHKARDEGKSIHAIETVEEQCNPAPSLSNDQIVFAINYTLSYLESADQKRSLHTKKERSHDIVSSYRCGRLEENIFETTDRTGFGFSPSIKEREMAKEIETLLRDDILVRRNERMANRLHAIFTAQPNTQFFTAIGTGHFLGDQNMLQLLSKKGYTIRQVQEKDALFFNQRRRDHVFNALWIRSREDTIAPIEVSIEVTSTTPSMISSHSSLIFTVIYLLLRLF